MAETFAQTPLITEPGSPIFVPGFISKLVRLLKRRPTYLFGFAMVGIMLVLSAVGPLIAPYPTEQADPAISLQPPSLAHWFGTDTTGMDVLSRTLAAPRIDLVIAILATAVSVSIGAPLGVVVGYFSGYGGVSGVMSEAVMRLADVVQAFPVFVLAMAMVVVTGHNLGNLVLVLAFLYAPFYLRLTRAEALIVRERLFVESARSIGEPELRLIRRHILPNSIGPAIAQMSTNTGWAILITASLSFVGAGIQIPTPEWGLMISAGATNVMTGEWWPFIFPGAAISLTVLGFALIGEAIEHLRNPVAN